MLRYYLNMNLRYKITILIFLLITGVACTLGAYSYKISKQQIINKVSNSNQSVLKQIDSNLARMQKTLADWVTVFSLAPVVQDTLRSNTPDSAKIENQLYNGPTASIMNQMLVTGSFDYLALYGSLSEPLFQVATDDSSGAYSLSKITSNDTYKQTVALNGASYWFPLTEENNVFIQSNRNDKLGMTRIIRDIVNGNRIGFVFVGINLETIRRTYLTNLYDKDHGILILSEQGTQLLSAGKETYSPEAIDFVMKQAKAGILSGNTIVSLEGKDTLLNYNINEDGWITLYSVPLRSLTQELNSIKSAVLVMVLASLVLSIPLLMFFSSFLTAPIKTLLLSMRRFQNGQFEEKVEIKYWDEIGQLSRGYNNMVGNIKALVDDAYLLKLKEQEAELKALQSQINPHFLYNMLDTIFWEAEAAGQDKISEMVINLSRLFRLSLNQGKSFTSVAKEKELIELYLSLQKMRFQESLEYVIDIPEELYAYVILKLSLQPFIENALIHGIERKRGGGRVSISGQRRGEKLIFVIEDNGSGMSEETLQKILTMPDETDVYTARDVGGYAVQNVQARLKHFYKGDYALNYSSVPGEGTRVEIVVPVIVTDMQE
ncbi:sensor histidine kinase [Paenibacillus sp. FSL P2-0089]|uniref:sensor histidine kinase n=1 Tax=Paenibacillus sp. FSL P2-0089 TaxID=2954526 RepID=UPI00315A95CC